MVEVEVFEHLFFADVFVVHLHKLFRIRCTYHFALYISNGDFFLSAVLIKQLLELVFLN